MSVKVLTHRTQDRKMLNIDSHYEELLF